MKVLMANRQRANGAGGGRAEPSALILLYHRIDRTPTDPQLLTVSPQHFAEHLLALRSWGRPTRLGDVIDAMRGGGTPDRAVVLTFDDGYADNLVNAEPILARHDVPATVFVTTGEAGHRREFWWDELDRLLLQPGILPARLDFHIAGRPFGWSLGEAAHYDGDAFRRYRGWNVLQDDDPSSRHGLYRALCDALRPLSAGRQGEVLDVLRAWAGARPEVRPAHRALSAEQIGRLAQCGTVEIGAHTVTHPVLAGMTPGDQRVEILDSKKRLERILGRPVTAFSYPYGVRSSYGVETVGIVREAGFACACANGSGLVRPGTDRYQLPRMVVRDWDGPALARRLREWQDHG